MKAECAKQGGTGAACDVAKRLQEKNKQTDKDYMDAFNSMKNKEKGAKQKLHDETVDMMKETSDVGGVSAEYEMGPAGNPSTNNL